MSAKLTDCFGIEVTSDEVKQWGFLTGAKTKEATPPHPTFWTQEFFISPEAIQDKVVMEFGCGLGVWGRQVAEYAKTYVGIDISRYSLHTAIAQHIDWDNMLFYHTIDDRRKILALKGKVGCIFTVSFFIHQTHERFMKMAELAYKLLEDGGLFSVDYIHGDVGKWGDNTCSHGADWRGIHRTEEELATMLAEAGFGNPKFHLSSNPRYIVDGIPRRGYVVSCKQGK